RRPCGAITPTSVKWPRSPLSSCVRCETSISRVLWRINAAWFSSERTPTNRIEGPRHRLADRRGIRSVVLLPANIRLHIGWRHHACVMAKLDQLARPVMRRPAGLEPDQTTRQRSEEFQQFVAPD